MLSIYLGRLLHKPNFPNYCVGKIDLIMIILYIYLWSNLLSALNYEKFALCNSLSMGCHSLNQPTNDTEQNKNYRDLI